MDVREKLQVIAHLGDHITYKENIGIFYDSALAKVIEDAYMTLKNGVTVQENCKSCAEATQNCIVKLQGQIAELRSVQEWISVKDGLPKLIPCDAGTAYSEAVNVLTSGRKVLTAIWDGFDWICDSEFWDAEDEEITHWSPVLLPLPQPPKGE